MPLRGRPVALNFDGMAASGKADPLNARPVRFFQKAFAEHLDELMFSLSVDQKIDKRIALKKMRGAIRDMRATRHHQAFGKAPPHQLGDLHVAAEVPHIAGKPNDVGLVHAIYDVLRRFRKKYRLSERIIAGQARVTLHRAPQQPMQIRKEWDLVERHNVDLAHSGSD